ncbi:macrophage erythroblast attacher isoform 1 [Ephemerocybe angulata]|uniref:Macrophage erythroblast attacher isoform 1 n=1 Tax=Ephemerocybe angulata TaxID=980116 RepID=A0A8H6IIA2_9AGAR|nr:macrophage erythroblast attacher isoform 1 [Tulosesus angulatus]
MNQKLNIEAILAVPYENYRKIFRISQKSIEKELASVQSSASELASRAAAGEADTEGALASLEGMIARVENLKQKKRLLNLPWMLCVNALNHLALIDTNDAPNPNEFTRWADTRLDRWIVDWCLRTAKERTAKQIAKEKHIETLVDIELFTDIRRIESALARHSCTEALSWCSENKAALRKVKSTLEFDLRLQEYIELSRARKSAEAITYLNKYLSQWHETHFPQISQASALLAFPPTTSCGPYRRLYEPIPPLLHLALYAGLVALKLPACYNPATKNVDCPVCESSGDTPLGLGKLAEEVPFSHHSNSTIVCRITGKIMNEDNPPMAFPNGNVYSREALEEMATKNGSVTCPRTGQTVNFAELKKVFIS